MNDNKRKFLKQISTASLLSLGFKDAFGVTDCDDLSKGTKGVNEEKGCVTILASCVGCTQCVRACPVDVLEMDHHGFASIRNSFNCISCKRCEQACPTDFLSIRVTIGCK